VFARTKRGAERLALSLAREGFSAAMIHGGRSQSQRNAALAGFQQGRYRVLVATDVASRGIHVENIAHVFNYDLPEIAENFIHRVGRTGRAGESGVASTLFGRDQRNDVLQLERTLGIRMERVPVDGSISRRNDLVPRQHPIEVDMGRLGQILPGASGRIARLPGEVLQIQMDS
jgi:ATP-dependent RNA helicase RhlE